MFASKAEIRWPYIILPSVSTVDLLDAGTPRIPVGYSQSKKDTFLKSGKRRVRCSFHKILF